MKPPARRLVANCCGKEGFRSFSRPPLSQRAPTSTRTHTMPFITRLLSFSVFGIVLPSSYAPALQGWPTEVSPSTLGVALEHY
jgi:hypothetical protein